MSLKPTIINGETKRKNRLTRNFSRPHDDDYFREKLETMCIPEPNSGCWLWLRNVNAWGYGQWKFRGSSWGSHRASYTLHKGEIPNGMHVLHKCDNSFCVNPDHLYLGTDLENNRDRVARNRQSKGEHHYKAKLTRLDVIAIRQSSQPTRKIARDYGVFPSTIRSVRQRETWSWLP